jgi:D-inositol-3-phosphate glycosyltransferase
VWAGVLADLLSAPSRLAALGRGAREHAAAFNWPATAERLVGVYTRAMNEAAAETVRA